MEQKLRNGRGWLVNGHEIPGLLFADDLTVIAPSEESLLQQLEVVKDFLHEKKLEINYDKTEILKR